MGHRGRGQPDSTVLCARAWHCAMNRSLSLWVYVDRVHLRKGKRDARVTVVATWANPGSTRLNGRGCHSGWAHGSEGEREMERRHSGVSALA